MPGPRAALTAEVSAWHDDGLTSDCTSDAILISGRIIDAIGRRLAKRKHHRTSLPARTSRSPADSSTSTSRFTIAFCSVIRITLTCCVPGRIAVSQGAARAGPGHRSPPGRTAAHRFRDSLQSGVQLAVGGHRREAIAALRAGSSMATTISSTWKTTATWIRARRPGLRRPDARIRHSQLVDAQSSLTISAQS